MNANIICRVISGHLTLLERMAARWLDVSDIDDVNWLPADRIVAGWAQTHLLGEKANI